MEEQQQQMCPKCYERNRAWSMYQVCPFCGAKGKPASEVYEKFTEPEVKAKWPTWQKRLHYIDVELAGRSQQTPTPMKPEDHAPYSPEELRLVILKKIPNPSGKGCDWCGGPWKTREEGPRMCNRCWNNREQIGAKIGLSQGIDFFGVSSCIIAAQRALQ